MTNISKDIINEQLVYDVINELRGDHSRHDKFDMTYRRCDKCPKLQDLIEQNRKLQSQLELKSNLCSNTQARLDDSTKSYENRLAEMRRRLEQKPKHHNMIDHNCYDCSIVLANLITHAQHCQQCKNEIYTKQGYVLKSSIPQPEIKETLCGSCTQKVLEAGIKVPEPKKDDALACLLGLGLLAKLASGQ